MGKGKAKRGIPSKVDDFNAWYPFIVEAAELVDKKDILSKEWMYGGHMDGVQ